MSLLICGMRIFKSLLSVFAILLLLFALSSSKGTPIAIAGTAEEINASTHVSFVRFEQCNIISTHLQEYCLIASVEEGEVVNEYHLGLFHVQLVRYPSYSLLFLSGIGSKVAKQAWNDVKRFLIFCNWRL